MSRTYSGCNEIEIFNVDHYLTIDDLVIAINVWLKNLNEEIKVISISPVISNQGLNQIIIHFKNKE